MTAWLSKNVERSAQKSISHTESLAYIHLSGIGCNVSISTSSCLHCFISFMIYCKLLCNGKCKCNHQIIYGKLCYDFILVLYTSYVTQHNTFYCLYVIYNLQTNVNSDHLVISLCSPTTPVLSIESLPISVKVLMEHVYRQ